jgi:hypothetical protein
VTNTTARMTTRNGKFLFNQLLGLTSFLTGGNDSGEDDDDEGKTKNCTCGEFYRCTLGQKPLRLIYKVNYCTSLTSIKIFFQNVAKLIRKIVSLGGGPQESIDTPGWLELSTTVISTAVPLC